jgi:hypothetical protein
MIDNALHWVNAGLRRTWLVALAAVIVCSVFAAHGIASLVEAQYLEPAPSSRPVSLHTVQVPAPINVITPDGSTFVTRNMFCSTCAAPGGGSGPTDSYQPPAILIATSVGADSRATLRVPATEAQGSWGLGDVVPGVGKIERIGFVSVDVIDIADPNRRGTLSLFDQLSGGRSDASAATLAPAAADPFADRVKKIDDTNYEVDRSLVRELVGGGGGASNGRVIPITKDGKLDGLRLAGVRTGSVASAVGLRNGDVLQAVNNTKIESANTLLTLYSQLDQLNNVELSGTRGGKPLTLTLRLR